MGRKALLPDLLSSSIQPRFSSPLDMSKLLNGIRGTHSHIVTIYSDRETYALSISRIVCCCYRTSLIRRTQRKPLSTVPFSNIGGPRRGLMVHFARLKFIGIPVCFAQSRPSVTANLTFDSSIGLYGRTYTTHHLLGGLTAGSRWSTYI